MAIAALAHLLQTRHAGTRRAGKSIELSHYEITSVAKPRVD